MEAEKNDDKDGKAFYKVMNKTVYGKTIKNFTNKVDVRMVNNKNDYFRWTSKSTYVTQEIFDNNLVAIHKIKITLTLNKPAYVGMCILELSKVPMYEFRYGYTKNKYGNKSRLLLTGTGSFMYEIETENAY